MKRLYRSQDNQMIGGVCAGIAEYFDIDPSIIRIIFAIAFLSNGFGFFLYIILWVILPIESSIEKESDVVIEENKTEIKHKIRKMTDTLKKEVKTDTQKKSKDI